MHVAYVCSDLGVPIAGTKGASIHVRSLAQALSLRGHRVTVLAGNPGSETVVGFRPEVLSIGYDRTLKRLKRRLAKSQPDTTMSREIYALLLGTLARRRLEELHRERPIDAVYERHSLWSWAALAFAREHGIPHLLELNAPLVREQATYRELTLGAVAQTCERELVSGTDAVIVPSEALAGHARRLGASAETIHLLPNAIDPSLFERARRLAPPSRQSPADRFVVAFVGSLKPWHGIDLLLRAFRRLLPSTPQAHLLVLGDGPMRGQVEQAVEELGRDRVTAPGAVPHRLVPLWLRRAHVGVAPYPRLADFYFSPMKVVEYQAAGLAAVASDLGHLTRQIRDGETGILVPPGDHIQLTGALARLARDPAETERLGRRARRAVLRRSTWPRVAARVESILAELGAAEGSPRRAEA